MFQWRRATISLASLQTSLVLLAFLLIAAPPPARGAMLLLPLSGQTSGQTLNVALRHGLRLVSVGPVPGSLIVSGTNSGVPRAMWRAGYLSLASPQRGCGSVL